MVLPLLMMFAALLTLSSESGCVQRTKLVLTPDSPLLVTSAEGGMRVATMDPQTGRLVDLPQVYDASGFVGWTLVRYDWTQAPGAVPHALPINPQTTGPVPATQPP